MPCQCLQPASLCWHSLLTHTPTVYFLSVSRGSGCVCSLYYFMYTNDLHTRRVYNVIDVYRRLIIVSWSRYSKVLAYFTLCRHFFSIDKCYRHFWTTIKWRRGCEDWLISVICWQRCTCSTWKYTGVCGQGMSNMFAAPPIKYFVIFFRLSIPNPNRNPNLKP